MSGCLVFSESVLLVAPVGLQLTATYQCGHQTSQFIPWHFITDVIINEAITQVYKKYLWFAELLSVYKSYSKQKLTLLQAYTSLLNVGLY
jgi:hypothetical protein